MSDFLVRDAAARDASGIRDIYNDAVVNTNAIWNEQVVDEANRVAWLHARQGMGYPVLVAVNAEEGVLGYASFGDWRAFDGYRHTVEHSVYVHPDARGQGVAQLLMQMLIERAREKGVGQEINLAG